MLTEEDVESLVEVVAGAVLIAEVVTGAVLIAEVVAGAVIIAEVVVSSIAGVIMVVAGTVKVGVMGGEFFLRVLAPVLLMFVNVTETIVESTELAT